MMTVPTQTSVALADDHKLFRDGLAEIINGFAAYQVTLEADTGRDLIDRLNPKQLPNLLLLDINMPQMDGYETANWFKTHFPSVKIIALSMYDSEIAVIRMLKAGARGYLLKDIRKQELKDALDSVVSRGYFYTDMLTNRLIDTVKKMDDGDPANELIHLIGLNDRLNEFLKLACTELTYKEIADKMCLSVHTIDGYRDTLFEKFRVKSRVGLLLYCLKAGIL